MKKQREMNGILENYKRLKMMKTFGGKRPTTRLAMKAGHLRITLYVVPKRIGFTPALVYFQARKAIRLAF